MALLSREQKRAIIIKIAPGFIYFVLWVIYLTCRNRFHFYKDVEKENFIASFWHGELVMQTFSYRKLRKIPKLYILSSQHFDGDIMVEFYAKFGLKTIRGSSSRGGIRALIESIKVINSGYDMGITPDGPKGPCFSVADGVVAMAQKSQKNVVPCRVVSSRYFQLNTWDKTRIPKPFSTIDYYVMPPFRISPDMPMEEAKKLIYDKMMQNPKEVFGDD